MAGEDRIERLASLAGIPAGYTDAFGQHVAVGLDRRRAMLGHLGFPADDPDAAEESLRRLIALREGPLPRVAALVADRPGEIPIRTALPAGTTWRLVDEAGAAREGAAPARGPLRLPVLRAGYHDLRLAAGASTLAQATLVVAPSQCWQPGWMRERGRAWGLAAQIYGLRSATNLGIGSYGDVREAARGAAPLGASFIGLSPVHALFAADRGKISPYSPSSRLFLESIHIDPQAVPGFAGSEAARMIAETATAARIAALRETPLVDHAAVWAELSPLLESLWAEDGLSTVGFDAFRRAGGPRLEQHARFEALSEHFRAEGCWWLGDWPAEYRDPASAAVARFAAGKEDRVAYHAWLQFLADEQLGNAAAAARKAGMNVGLYRDLAVGSDRGGSEVWSNPERFGATLSIGAPPDLLAPQGQDWGIPPLNPIVLEEQGLAAFRELVVANMRHAGAIRIDHAFQLQRLYLIPVGEGGPSGAYVEYPFEAMLAVLRLESHRARALVIAEDLGTAPDGFSDAIMASGLLSYRVLAFEHDAAGGFKPPDAYPRDALSVITTHDLATFVGWWGGLDTDLRQALGIYDPERGERERGERVADRARLAEALFAERLLGSPEPPETAPLEAAMRYLARTPSVLNAIQYEDVLGARNQPNVPGTTDEHPNWRRKLELDLDAIDAPNGPLAKVAAAVSAEGRGTRAGTAPLAAPAPRATYRFQFHRDFGFGDAIPALPYLTALGISHVYASPIAEARAGSTHGYDIVRPSAINPELGGEEAFLRFSDALKAHGLGLILDIVPNHLGVGGADNAWWLRMLEWGQLAPESQAFDVDWERLGANGRLVIPVLGDRYGEALEKGDLRLAFDAPEGSFSVWHHEHRLPLSPLSYPLILDRALAALESIDGHPELIAISDRLRSMADEALPGRRAAFPAEGDALKARLSAAVAASDALRRAIDRAVAVVNGVPGLPESFGTLHRILEMQSYRPAHWRVAASDINYRRFFDINGLAGIRVEVPAIFEEIHALPFRLVREGRVQGLRIDHIDGLADPEGYVQAVQAAVGPGFYVVVEKILEPGEALRPWLVAGTTGYDALNQIDGVFVDGSVRGRFDRIYRDATGLEGRYPDLLRAAKIEILQASFASELEVLVSDLKRVADGDRRTRDYTVYGIRIALSEIVARFPVYRSYITDAEPSPEDVALVEKTVAAAKRTSVLPDRSVHDFAADVLLGRIDTAGSGRPLPDHISRFRRRFQQLTGPVMAKSLEDTLFYRYVPLLSLNEVGGDPGLFGTSVAAFHAANAERAQAWPHAMIATSTHDTKRGEDARARLYALTWMPDAWADAVARFETVASPHLGRSDGDAAPDANDRFMILQALLGAWPLELLDGDDEGAREDFRTRFQAYLQKALRESKRRSSWVNPNEDYERAAAKLVDALLAAGSGFIGAFRPLARTLAEAGMRTGLARTVLKCTLPGVPDIYQGTAFWDVSLVDPDNRRPVDYAARAAALIEPAPVADLLARWTDGHIKQRLLQILLADRAASPRLYADGAYRPVETPDDGVVAFSRELGPDALVVAVLRRADRMGEGAIEIGAGSWRDLLSGRILEGGRAALRELFADLPVAVLRRTA